MKGGMNQCPCRRTPPLLPVACVMQTRVTVSNAATYGWAKVGAARFKLLADPEE